MADVFAPFAAKDTPTEIHGFVGTVVISCDCGSKRPLIVPFSIGAQGGAECGQCRTIWSVLSLSMTGNNVSFRFGKKIPAIVPAHSMPV